MPDLANRCENQKTLGENLPHAARRSGGVGRWYLMVLGAFGTLMALGVLMVPKALGVFGILTVPRVLGVFGILTVPKVLGAFGPLNTIRSSSEYVRTRGI